LNGETCPNLLFHRSASGVNLTPIIDGVLPALIDLRLEARANNKKRASRHVRLPEGEGMAAEECQHPSHVIGVVDLDVSRLETPSDHSVYSMEVSIVVCEGCGHIELYAKSPHALCDWLRKRT
jgi:hypothetical protein